MGTGIGHLIPLLAYLGFWAMCLVSLGGKPLYGLYYMLPFLPYRTLRDKFLDYPLGANVLTILVVAVIAGALFHGKRLPKSKLYLTWLLLALYCYFSMWIGTALGNAPAPIWLDDPNFVTWKDYMLLPLLLLAAGLVVEDRKAIRTIILLTAASLLLVDKSALAESLSHTWGAFDENKRGSGPIEYGPNQLAAFLAQFGMFFWGFGQFLKRRSVKLTLYALTAITLLATMYTFSRGAYLAVIASATLLAILKDRKLLIVVAVFLLTWQAIVPDAVRERITMTENTSGQLEASAQERIDLWTQSKRMFLSSPVVGTGFGTFQLGEHTDNLKDTHNFYVKVLVETGLVGFVIVLALLYQLTATCFRLFRRADDPLYRALGLGLLLALCASVVANFFGDRWTYIEIMGLLWVLVGSATRAQQLMLTVPVAAPANDQLEASQAIPAYMVWR
jgi:O-antigen ligase